ncbi:hypothetical protein [Actinobacillus minor]|uniref:hypothetical protein n=1 Tax=Actinobacillus minor TaxID=51047 RepID=UPI0026EA1807|nr:hypothetical protein [Actinobacillus minor]
MLRKILIFNSFVLTALPSLAISTNPIQEAQLLGIWDCVRADKALEAAFIFGKDNKVEVIIDYFELTHNKRKPISKREDRFGIWQIMENQLVLTVESDATEQSIKRITEPQIFLFDVKQLTKKHMQIRELGNDFDMMCKMVKKG